MIKKINILIFLLCVLVVPQSALATDSNYGYYGTTSTSSPLYANSSNGDAAHWFDVSVAGSGTGYVVWGKNDGTGHLVEMSRNPVPANNVEPPGTGAIAFWLESTGGEIYATIGHTNNPNNLSVYFTSGSDGSGGSGGSGDCAVCQMFSCPGWGEYMQGLEDIKNAIPPAPNWQIVANTFRDTIAPRVKSDFEDLFGYASDPPSIPGAPAAPARPSAPAPETPALPSDLDDRGITAPTGQETPDLGDSTFDPSDIKNQAPVITEREDPTGGFTILDPIAGLPSQDEFKQNAPIEGTAPLPGAPTEESNIAPIPPEGSNTAPKPSEGDNTAPIPNEGSGKGPIPNESGTAPIPNESWNPPIPR